MPWPTQIKKIMIFRTTHPEPEYTEQSRLLVGKPFSWIEKLKMGRIGSGRMMIEGISQGLKPKQLSFSEIDYGNIELRPNGVILHFTHRLERYSWIIPYYRLVIYNTTYFSIHAEGQYIRFRKNKLYKNNKGFIDTMRKKQHELLDLGYYEY